MLYLIAATFVVLALATQWRDCVREYGNTPGAEGLCRSLWLFASIALVIAVGRSSGWLLGLAAGVVLYAVSYAIFDGVRRLGMRYGPRGP